jgi:hypothetical protein
MLDEPHNSSMNFDPTKVKVFGKMNGIFKTLIYFMLSHENTDDALLSFN